MIESNAVMWAIYFNARKVTNIRSDENCSQPSEFMSGSNKWLWLSWSAQCSTHWYVYVCVCVWSVLLECCALCTVNMELNQLCRRAHFNSLVPISKADAIIGVFCVLQIEEKRGETRFTPELLDIRWNTSFQSHDIKNSLNTIHQLRDYSIQFRYDYSIIEIIAFNNGSMKFEAVMQVISKDRRKICSIKRTRTVPSKHSACAERCYSGRGLPEDNLYASPSRDKLLRAHLLATTVARTQRMPEPSLCSQQHVRREVLNSFRKLFASKYPSMRSVCAYLRQDFLGYSFFDEVSTMISFS